MPIKNTLTLRRTAQTTEGPQYEHGAAIQLPGNVANPPCGRCSLGHGRLTTCVMQLRVLVSIWTQTLAERYRMPG